MIPPPLRGADPGSFAEETVRERWPRIVAEVVRENTFPEGINRRLWALYRELPHGRLRLLEDPGAPDEILWNAWIRPHLGETWSSAPWLFAEHYLYRRILEATAYFQPGPTYRLDPFRRPKRRALEVARREAPGWARQAMAWTETPEGARQALPEALRLALWGNQMDLSMWSVEEAPRHGNEAAAFLLVDDTPHFMEYLERKGPLHRVDLLADNVGVELLGDLLLIDVLLASGHVREVWMHLKAEPTFVSDALVADVHETLEVLEGHEEAVVTTWARRLRAYLATGRWVLVDGLTWHMPCPMRRFPGLVLSDLARSDLLLVKGDAHYRRLVDDAHWPPETPFCRVVRYLRMPLLALRTLKAEVVVGLTPERLREVARNDPEWMVNGRWGMIQGCFVRAGG